MRSIIAAVGLLAATPTQAEVISSTSNGFHLRHTADLRIPPDAAFRRFAHIGSWWNPAHSFSGDAKNLSLALRAGGCFCEALPGGGGVEHLRVSYWQPGKRAVLTGALGPLLFQAVTGVMDVQIEPTATGSRLTLSYKAAGFATGGADKLAPIVDTVVGEQVNRFAAYAGTKP